jgi:predicted porin
MRKLLLATVAGLAAWGAVATDASAQSFTNSVYTGAPAEKMAAPTPGTVVVRLNGRVRFYAYEANQGDANTPGNKLASYGFAEYARLYPGFDGVAANGLKYGANLEIRQDAAAGAGGGTQGSISGQDPKRAELYFRRVWGYIGTDQLGTIRVGSIDQPTSLYLTGNYENFNDGGWNGDLPAMFAGNIAPAWPFEDVGSYYTTDKVVYLSPQIFGFDFGASFEPSTANVSYQSGCATGAAGSGCDALSSTSVNAETARRMNTFDVLLRYRGAFGPVGLAATAAYIGGGHVGFDSTSGFTNNPLAAGGATYNYQGLSIGDFGLEASVAGLSVGGHYSTGRFNGSVANTLPSGFPDSNAWLVGTSYTFGPVIVGASYFVANSAGDLSNAYYGRDRTDQGVALGGTYSVAPGFSVFLSGLWGERKQNGYNFVTGAGVTAATGAGGQTSGNKVSVSAVSIGTSFAW